MLLLTIELYRGGSTPVNHYSESESEHENKSRFSATRKQGARPDFEIPTISRHGASLASDASNALALLH